MHLTNKNKLLIINDYDIKLICISSCFFLIPTIFGLYECLYQCLYIVNILSYISLVTFIASILYWHNPINGIRRYFDYIVSNTSCVSYIISASYNINCLYTKLFIWCILFSLMFLFHKSLSLYNINNKNWVYFHMFFHLMVTFGKFVILYNIIYQ
jgi:hypothetical protein